MLPRIRVVPEDFLVEELPSIEPDGQGQHLWLWVEKRLRGTDQVIDDLARGLDIPSRDIGYAGRKDHRAVTRQWISIPALLEPELDDLDLPRAAVLRKVRHGQRLRLGDLDGNRFVLRIGQVDADTLNHLEKRWDELVQRGVPNRFGRQRFGNDGQNARRGAEMLRRGRIRGPRRRAFLMLSALQSEVFNAVLERRGEAYDQLQAGDLAYRHATGEIQQVQDPADFEAERLEQKVSATGPMFGSKMRWPRGEVIEAEEAVMESMDLPPLRRLDLPRNFKLYGDRRPLRVPLRDASWEHRDDDVELRFVLPPGSYATVVLDALLPGGYGEGPEDTKDGAEGIKAPSSTTD